MERDSYRDNINVIDSTIVAMTGLIGMIERQAEGAGSMMVMVKLMAEALERDIDDIVVEFERAQIEGKNTVTAAKEFVGIIGEYSNHLERRVGG